MNSSSTAASEHTRIREFHEEEERIKLKLLQVDAGLVSNHEILVTAERMDWMYHNPAQSKKEAENEEFLLGKAVTTTDEREEMKKRLAVGTTVPGSLFLSSVTAQNDDTLRRLREDPLFLIRQAEHQQHRMGVARDKILGKMRNEDQQKEKKKEKKEKKENKREDGRSDFNRNRERRHSYQVDNQEEDTRKRHRINEDGRYRDRKHDKNYYRRKLCGYVGNGSSPKRMSIERRKDYDWNERRNKEPYDRRQWTDDKREVRGKDGRFDQHLDWEHERNPDRDGHSRNYRGEDCGDSESFSPRFRHRELDSDKMGKFRKKNAEEQFSRYREKSIENYGSLKEGEQKDHRSIDTKKDYREVWNRTESPNNVTPDQYSEEVKSEVPKGPVLPREWKERLKDEEKKKALRRNSSDSDSCSSESDLGPPQQMSNLLKQRRSDRDGVPLLKNRKRVLNVEGQRSITDAVVPSESLERKPEKSEGKNEEGEDVFASCRQALENEDQRRLREMMEEGKRHETEKDDRLDSLETIEKLKEVFEAKRRAATAEMGSDLIRNFQKDAYANDKQTLEQRMKRYAARRKKGVIEDNLLDNS